MVFPDIAKDTLALKAKNSIGAKPDQINYLNTLNSLSWLIWKSLCIDDFVRTWKNLTAPVKKVETDIYCRGRFLRLYIRISTVMQHIKEAQVAVC